MTNNKRMWKCSGGDVHKFLMKESFRKLKLEGYNVSIEHKLDSGRIDVFGIKDNYKIGIECIVRPTLSFINKKKELYSRSLDKLLFCYPSEYNMKFPIEDVCDIFVVDLPEYLCRTYFNFDSKLKDGYFKKLKIIRDRNPGKVISIVTVNKSNGQKILTVPKNCNIGDGNLVMLTKIEEPTQMNNDKEVQYNGRDGTGDSGGSRYDSGGSPSTE